MTEDTTRVNQFGQPIGRAVDWTPAAEPRPRLLAGRHVTLEPLLPEHAPELLKAIGNLPELWTYLPAEAPTTVPEMTAVVELQLALPDALPFLVRDAHGAAQGTLAYLRIQPAIGSIEVGWVTFGPGLQQTPASTEAQFLLMRHAFEDLGYRRYEWKCDSLNGPSVRAARRLGFTDEGVWRNALVTKGRNRDTRWLSITAEEWPAVKAALESWLHEDNFVDGRQIRSLSSLR